MIEYQIGPDDAEQRFDRFLRKLLRRAPHPAIQRLIRTGKARIDEQRSKGDTLLKEGHRVQLDLGETERLSWIEDREDQRIERPLSILYRDDDVCIVDKPPGLAVHGGTGIDDHLIGRLLAVLERTDSATFRPAPAHRIDRPTSGLVAVGASARGLRGLTEAFRDGSVDKVYITVVEGVPAPQDGRIDAALRVLEDAGDGPRAVVDDDGLPAVTRYRTVREGRHRALLQLAIDTGRTHQIRAHLSALGHPVLGDTRYGATQTEGLAGRELFLHAQRLRFAHPITGKTIDTQSPVPRVFVRALD